MSKRGRLIGVCMSESKTEFGKHLRKWRIANKLTQADAAALAGISQGKFSSLEIGVCRNLSDKLFADLARALQCEQSELKALVPRKLAKTELGYFIQCRREELGLSIEKLAEKLHMPLRSVRIFETHKRKKTLGYKQIKPFAKALEVNTADLVKFLSYSGNETTSNFGQAIRFRRKTLGFSGIAVSKQTGFSKQLLSQVELGQVRLSSKNCKMLKHLARVLDLDASILLELVDRRKLKRNFTNIITLGDFLVAQRLELNLTQKELAERANIDNSSISRIESGKIKPRKQTLQKFIKVFDCEIPKQLMNINLGPLCK